MAGKAAADVRHKTDTARKNQPVSIHCRARSLQVLNRLVGSSQDAPGSFRA
jgi:hypothetical protein